MIAASAAILLFGPTMAVADAAPAPVDLPAQLVEAVTRDLKISPTEYLRRADVAQQVAAFSTTAQRQFPQVFAGSWLNDQGNAVVALSHGPGTAEAREAAQSAGFEVREVAKSESTLRGEKTAFEYWLAAAPAEVSALVGRYGGNEESFHDAGHAFTVELVRRFLKEGADGIHLYTLNRYSDVANVVFDAGLRSRLPKE